MVFLSSPDRNLYLTTLCVILAIGAFLRLPPVAFLGPNAPLHSLSSLHPMSQWAAMDKMGMDEGLYRDYVNQVIGAGLTSYPEIIQHYMEVQRPRTGSILPPTRFLYIFAAYTWHQVFGSDAFTALKCVSSFFGVLTLVLSTVFAGSLKGPALALGVAALISFAPTQIHMSQHALVDGFFTFWALLCLWALWENLRAPGNWFWLAAYIVALCCWS